MFSKLGKGPELVEACIDLGAGEITKAVDAEPFAAETAQHRSVNDSPAEFLVADVALFEVEAALGEIADEAAGEAVARASRVEDFIQQIPRDDGMSVGTEQDRAVLADSILVFMTLFDRMPFRSIPSLRFSSECMIPLTRPSARSGA